MIVIAVGQSKGGVGKTTISVNLAGALAHAGRSVNLVDADPQGAAAQWGEAYQLNFNLQRYPLAMLDKMSWIIDVLKTKADVTIIDLPAGFGETFEAAVAIADLLVIPCVPSSLDIRAAESTIAKARQLRQLSQVSTTLKIATVPTRVDYNHEEGWELVNALVDLGEPVAPPLSYDIEFVRSFTNGTTLISGSASTKAASEMLRLTDSLIKCMSEHAPAPARTRRLRSVVA